MLKDRASSGKSIISRFVSRGNACSAREGKDTCVEKYKTVEGKASSGIKRSSFDYSSFSPPFRSFSLEITLGKGLREISWRLIN